MKKENDSHHEATKVVIDKMRKWPTLFRNSGDFYYASVVGDQGGYHWINGLLVDNEDKRYLGTINEKPQWGEYEYQISEEVAYDLFYPQSRVFVSVNMPCYKNSPIMSLPDDLHKDWQHFIGMQLLYDEKLTPELYHVTRQAYFIMEWGSPEHPKMGGHYESDWANYHSKIPSFLARLDVIREQQETGKIPERTFVGMYI